LKAQHVTHAAGIPAISDVTESKRTSRLLIQLLGEMRVIEQGAERPLPQSKKTRGLLAYLALEARRHRREELCDLLWESPSDPRAALRWSLAKLRPVLAINGSNPLVADRVSVALDHALVAVDLLQIRAAMTENPAALGDSGLLDFDHRLTGGCLHGLEDTGSARFQLWLQSEREAVRRLHQEVISEMMARASSQPARLIHLARRKVALDPLDTAANADYLRLVLSQEGMREARSVFEGVRDLYRLEHQSDEELLAAWHRISRTPKTSLDSGKPETTMIVAAEGRPVVHVLPDEPSVAVLDFADVGVHSVGAVLANGLTVDLNARIAQLPNLFVIARASAARIAAQRLSPQQAGNKLGVRYLVTGTTQREIRRVRVTVALLDATDAREVWSDRFDRPLDDLFQLQDEITDAVAAAIEPAIQRAEMQRALMKPPENLTAWENYHRGLWHSFRFTARDNEIAGELFRQALARDPHFSRAHAGMAFTHYSRAFLDAAVDVDREIHNSLESAQQSVGYDNRDAMGHWALGRALFLSRRHDEAMTAVNRALSINRNFALGHYARAFVGLHAGVEAAVLPSLATAERLSPFDPLLFAMKSTRALTLAGNQQYEEAAEWAVVATHEPNAHFHIYAIAAACLELAGRSEDARNHARWVLKRHPDYSLEVFKRSFPHKDDANRGPLLAALARAGIPAGK
jgi:TolB-like protein/DNA-binding SARP family transcriptional activator